MLRRVLGEDIEFSMLTFTRVGTVLADPGQIEQILLNLLVNARDAMPRGGKLSIETGDVEPRCDVCSATSRSHCGRYVMMAVSDTGVGMDTDTLRHIFEPFFTTKPAGKGTGLGLATVFGIVKQSGGQHLGLQRARQGHHLQGLLSSRRHGTRPRSESSAHGRSERQRNGAGRRRSRAGAGPGTDDPRALGLRCTRSPKRRRSAARLRTVRSQDPPLDHRRGDAPHERQTARGATSPMCAPE